MKKYAIIIIVLFFSACQTTPKLAPEAKTKPEIVQANDTVMYGFRFVIPKSYHKITDDVSATDLHGNIRSRETAYKDSLTGAEIHIILHPEPYGKTLYDYYSELTEKQKATTTNIAGLPAVKQTEKILLNGKGHPLDKPVIRQKYFVLDQGNNCLELVFNQTKDDEKIDIEFQKFIREIRKL